MKKRLVMVMLVVGLLSGCGKNDEINENREVETSKVEEKENSEKKFSSSQIETVYSLRDKWEIKDSELETEDGEVINLDDYGYAISDLDNDGNYEVVVSGWAGTGHFSTSYIYEYVDENNLEKWDTSDFSNKDSEPDLILQNAINGIEDSDYEMIKVYLKDDEIPVYLMTDKEYWGADGGEIRYLKVTIEDNVVFSQLLGIKQDSASKGISYYNPDEEELSEEEFTSLINEGFVGYEEATVALDWFEDVTEETIEKSYSVCIDSLTK